MNKARLLTLFIAALVIGTAHSNPDDSASVQLESQPEPDCEKYFRFQEAWEAGNFSAEWDGRQLNTEDVAGCTDSVAVAGLLGVSTSQGMSFDGPGMRVVRLYEVVDC